MCTERVIRKLLPNFAEVKLMIEELWESDNIENYIVNENNIEEYGGSEELQLVKEKKLDKDRCSFVWKKLYCEHYKSAFWNDTKWNNYKDRIKSRKNPYEVMHIESNCRFSGDVLFSFKSENDDAKRKGKKYEHYFNFINDDDKLEEENKKHYLEILSFCNRMNYSLHNMGLMPVVGNLQTVKERYWDRLDRYIFFLNEYFTIENKEKADLIEKVPSSGGRYPVEVINETDIVKKEKMKDDIKDKRKVQAQNEVSEVFKKIENIAKESGIEDVKDENENGVNIKAGTILYCREMYLIDNNDFLARLIKNGSQPIKNSSDVVNYMKLAIEYWKMKDEILKSK